MYCTCVSRVQDEPPGLPVTGCHRPVPQNLTCPISLGRILCALYKCRCNGTGTGTSKGSTGHIAAWTLDPGPAILWEGLNLNVSSSSLWVSRTVLLCCRRHRDAHHLLYISESCHIHALHLPRYLVGIRTALSLKLCVDQPPPPITVRASAQAAERRSCLTTLPDRI